MNEVTTVLEGMNEDGNWEDKLIIMRDALGELRQLSHRRRVRSHDDVVRVDAPLHPFERIWSPSGIVYTFYLRTESLDMTLYESMNLSLLRRVKRITYLC
ncbi:hypothetical protein A0H81_07176 [Grifola frondosa]|uniref:Uncharacterized protein n=1 Tax=Grifola frondosa TaxID=5627 RepID=A0A1C7M8Y1_GRIFR|nr:hypothetical protein A0H81_07176 [Grifola frondosa]